MCEKNKSVRVNIRGNSKYKGERQKKKMKWIEVKRKIGGIKKSKKTLRIQIENQGKRISAQGTIFLYSDDSGGLAGTHAPGSNCLKKSGRIS